MIHFNIILKLYYSNITNFTISIPNMNKIQEIKVLLVK